jgi:3-methyladenine DNA glycosylase AlkD
MVRKALSWALRELSKRDRDAVIGFIEKYRDRMSKMVIREVTHKLEYGTKN